MFSRFTVTNFDNWTIFMYVQCSFIFSFGLIMLGQKNMLVKAYKYVFFQVSFLMFLCQEWTFLKFF